MKKYAVIVAGGYGERMGAPIPKQFLLLQSKPLLWHSINTFQNTFPDITVILVLPAEHLDAGLEMIQELNERNNIIITQGGITRFHSVQNGLKLVEEPSVVFVHDSVRCLVTGTLITECYQQALEKGSAIPAVAVTDSIRILNTTGKGHLVADRQYVRMIQTPQTFLSSILLPAFNVDYHPGFTDEATVVEASGNEVFLIEGEYGNIKITRPADLLLAERILADRSAF